MRSLVIVKVFSILIISLISSGAVAQKYSFVFESGYSIPSSKRLLFITRSASTSEAVLGSYGSGINVGVGFEREINKYFYFGIKGRFNIGNKIKAISLILAPNGVDAQVNIVSRSNSYYFIPNISAQTSFDKKVQLYASYGLIIAKPKIDFEYFQRNSTNTISVLSYKEKLTHRLNVGSSIESGLSFASGPNMITLGVEFVVFSPLYAESEITEFFFNGKDQLSSLGVTKITYDKTVKRNDPKSALVDSSPFGSISIKVGFKFKLISKERVA